MMRRNCVIILCLALVFLLVTDSSDAQNTKQITYTGKVVNEQDQPVDGVKVSLVEMDFDQTDYSYSPKLLTEVRTEADGAFSFNESVIDNQYRYAYIVADKEGLAVGFDNWNIRGGDKQCQIKMGPPKELSGIVVDENDKPIQDAEVAVMILALGEGREQQNLNSLIVPNLLITKTGITGKFTFSRIPAGAAAEFIAKKAGRATISTYKNTNQPYQKLNFEEGQKDIKLLLPIESRIEGKVAEKVTGKPVGGLKINYSSGNESGYFRPEPLVSKEDGTFTIDALAASNYVLSLSQSNVELPDWVGDSVEVITETGKTKSDVKLEVNKGGILEVKITDAVNKEPIEEAQVNVASQNRNRSAYSRTDKSGTARTRLMPGDYQVSSIYKQGYSRQRLQETVTIEDGKTEQIEYKLTGLPRIVGTVFDQDNKPIEAVQLDICPGVSRDECISGPDGKFEITYDIGNWPGSRTPVMILVGRQYERNLAVAVQIEEDTREIELKLEPALTMFGQIVDPDGRGLADVEVRTMLHGPTWGSTIGRKPVITDKDGKYEIKAIPPENEYNVYASADGYGQSRGEQISTSTAVDNRLDMGSLTLAVANLSVSGIVVDDSGKPVAGARINGYGDNQPHINTQTDTDGKFTLEGICAGKIRLSASKTGTTRLSGSLETDGGATDVRITISERPTSTRYEPKRPPSLVDRPLPELKNAGIDLPPADTDEKMLLVCFFDMEQRPSRHCITQLAKQAEQLKSKQVTVIAVQASKIELDTLTQWKNKYKIPFPVGMVEGDVEKARFTWGVRSLPWLILTDSEHIIRAAGFPVNELSEKIGEMENAER